MDFYNSANGLDTEERIMLCEAKNINQASVFQERYLICMKSHFAHSHHISFSTMKTSICKSNWLPRHCINSLTLDSFVVQQVMWSKGKVHTASYSYGCS